MTARRSLLMNWSTCCSRALRSQIFIPVKHRHHVRSQSTALHFYQNRQLELYASKEAKRLTLRQLVFFGRSMDEDRLIKSANYVRTELAIRIAHRLRDLQALPYVVVTQEGVTKVYELYWSAFERIRRFPPITSIAENTVFCSSLRQLLDEHATVIPNLSLGLSISSPYLAPDLLDSFMRRMLISRISRRVLAEHHLALSDSFTKHGEESENGERHVGIIYTGLNIKRSIDKCTNLLKRHSHRIDENLAQIIPCPDWPDVVVDGHLHTNFAYIKEHLEYILFELVKNAMLATVLKYREAPVLPPIRATIVAGTDDVGIRISDQGGGILTPQIKRPSDLFSFSHVRNASRMDDSRLGALRTVSSNPRGVMATVGEQVGNEGEQRQEEKGMQSHPESPKHNIGLAAHPRIGIGLPMSNIYATYFGGSLELVSLDGWGTDVYLRLPKLGTNLEGIEV